MRNRIKKMWLGGGAALAVSAAAFGMAMIPTGAAYAQGPGWTRNSFYSHRYYTHGPYHHPNPYSWEYFHNGPYANEYYPYSAFRGHHFHSAH